MSASWRWIADLPAALVTALAGVLVAAPAAPSVLGLLLVPAASLALLAAPAPPLAAQESVEIRVPGAGVLQELVLRDGSVLFGRVIEAGDPLVFERASGQLIEFSHADVREISEARGRFVGGEFWRDDPNRTRLFFGTTARMLESGEGSFSVFEILFPILAQGVHDRVTVAGGTSLFMYGWDDHPFWFAPKVGIASTERFDLAAGVLAFFTTGSSESIGLLYGIASLGEPDQAVHVGAGWGYDRGGLASRPAVMLGGELRVSPMVKLLTENYLFPSDGGIASAGFRFFGERLSADIGLAAPMDAGDFFVFPVLNFSWNWF